MGDVYEKQFKESYINDVVLGDGVCYDAEFFRG